MSSKDARSRHLRNIAEARATLDRLKTSHGCVDCGYSDHPAALHFDHINPATKRADLGWAPDRTRLITKAKLRRFLDHVDQYCEIRCANCHAKRSFDERHWAGVSGGSTVTVTDPVLFEVG